MDKKLMAMGTSMLILKLLGTEDMYGYQMIRELEGRSENIFSLKEGTLYPILHNLERQGDIESYEKVSETGRKRKYYHLTRSGNKTLAQKQEEWNIYRNAVENVLKAPVYESDASGYIGMLLENGGVTYGI